MFLGNIGIAIYFPWLGFFNFFNSGKLLKLNFIKLNIQKKQNKTKQTKKISNKKSRFTDGFMVIILDKPAKQKLIN